MGINSSRTRYENELIHVLKNSLEENWFGQRGTHSNGVDVIMFKEGETNWKPTAVLFEVKSFKEWPFYINGKNKTQYERYLELLESYGIEVIYALRIVGSKEKEKWRFAKLTDFSLTNRGNACTKLENTGGLLTLVSTMNG